MSQSASDPSPASCFDWLDWFWQQLFWWSALGLLILIPIGFVTLLPPLRPINDRIAVVALYLLYAMFSGIGLGLLTGVLTGIEWLVRKWFSRASANRREEG